VKKVRQFEENLLKNYQAFLRDLEAVAEKNMPKRPATNIGLLHTALHCFCQLLQSCRHFNFSTNLMSSVVARMNLALPNTLAEQFRLQSKSISSLCCQTVEEVFLSDPLGNDTLRVVELIAKLIKQKRFAIQPQVIDTFLKLELVVKPNHSKTEHQKRGKKQPAKHVSRKQKKALKYDREIKSELKEAEAIVNQEEKARVVRFSELISHK
jgi:nucleolar complex protein 3